MSISIEQFLKLAPEQETNAMIVKLADAQIKAMEAITHHLKTLEAQNELHYEWDETAVDRLKKLREQFQSQSINNHAIPD